MVASLTASQQHWVEIAAQHADNCASRAAPHDREGRGLTGEQGYTVYASTSALQSAYEALEKSQREPFPYTIAQCGESFVVLREVFSPKYLPACELFAEKLPFAPGASFLEIGAGVGVTAIMAALKGARRVVATDINPAAVENIRQNVVRHGLSDVVEVRQGSIFEPLRPDETFDLIFWNIPFLLVEPATALSLLQCTVADPGYRAAERFLSTGRRYLTPERGRLMFGFSSTIGNLPVLQQIAGLHGIRLALFHCEPDYRSQHMMQMEIFEARYVDREGLARGKVR